MIKQSIIICISLLLTGCYSSYGKREIISPYTGKEIPVSSVDSSYKKYENKSILGVSGDFFINCEEQEKILTAPFLLLTIATLSLSNVFGLPALHISYQCDVSFTPNKEQKVQISVGRHMQEIYFSEHLNSSYQAQGDSDSAWINLWYSENTREYLRKQAVDIAVNKIKKQLDGDMTKIASQEKEASKNLQNRENKDLDIDTRMLKLKELME